MAKLQAKTEEQKKFIESFNNAACTFMNILDDTVEIDGCISFDEMAEIVDYLRSDECSIKVDEPNLLSKI